MLLCFTACCKRGDIHFIRLDFHPELSFGSNWRQGGCCALLSLEPSPTSYLKIQTHMNEDAGGVVFLFRQTPRSCDFQLPLILGKSN